MLRYRKCRICGVAFRANGYERMNGRLHRHFREFHKEIYKEMTEQKRKASKRLHQFREQLSREYPYIKINHIWVRDNLPVDKLTAEQYKGEPKKKR